MAAAAGADGAVPDRRYRHYALGVLTVVYFFNFADRQVLAVLLEDIKLEFALSDTELGLLSGLAFALFYSTLGIPIARLADRANRVKIVAGACAVWSLATAACGLAANFVQLLLARIAVGVGEAGCAPPTHAVLADYYHKSELSRALGILTAAAPAGAIAGVILGGIIAESWGWRYAFIVVGLPGLLVAAVAFFTLREPERGRLSETPPSGDRPAFLDTAKRLFANRVFLFVTLGNAFAVMMAYVVANWAPPLYRRVFELGAAEVGLYAALGIVIGGLPGTIAGGIMSDMLVRRDPRWQGWMPAIGLAIAFPLLLTAPFSPTVFGAALVFAAGTFFANLCLGPAAALIQTVARPDERALAASLYIFVGSGLGIGVGPLVVGLLSDGFAPAYGTDSLRYAMAATSVLTLMGAAMFLAAAPALRRGNASD